MQTKNLKKIAKDIKIDIINMAYDSNSAHISSSLCVADIITTLYFHTMKINPKKPNNPNRDKFVLSKGHSASALYAALAKKGFFPKKLLKTYNQNGSILGDHPIYGLAGVELATGSLGHGLAVGVGMALANKINKSKNRVFVLISDAECQEGSIWESILFASQLKLDNLVLLIDYNKLQALGKVKDINNLEPFADKLKSFGWKTYNVDGHNLDELKKHLSVKIPNSPIALICNTIGGKGIDFMENDWKWHYRNLTKDEYEKALNLIQKI